MLNFHSLYIVIYMLFCHTAITHKCKQKIVECEFCTSQSEVSSVEKEAVVELSAYHTKYRLKSESL